MKKQRLFSVAVLIMLFALAPVHAQAVYPTFHNFGDVEVDNSVLTIVTLTNNAPVPVTIHRITLGGSGDFKLANTIPTPFSLGFGDEIEIEVVFTPSAEVAVSAYLDIINGSVLSVLLVGTGVAAQPPPVSIQDIINFFDASVANGTLEGDGSGSSAEGRLNALRNMLIKASYLISAGNYEGACTQLSAALQRCGDFVQGDSQDNLAQMISDLMDDLGC